MSRLEDRSYPFSPPIDPVTDYCAFELPPLRLTPPPPQRGPRTGPWPHPGPAAHGAGHVGGPRDHQRWPRPRDQASEVLRASPSCIAKHLMNTKIHPFCDTSEPKGLAPDQRYRPPGWGPSRCSSAISVPTPSPSLRPHLGRATRPRRLSV